MPPETPSLHDDLSEPIEIPRYEQVIPIAYSYGLGNRVNSLMVKDVKTGRIVDFDYYTDWKEPIRIASPKTKDEEDEARILIAVKGDVTFLDKEDIPTKPISREELPEFARQLAEKLNKKKTQNDLGSLSHEVSP